MVTERYDHSFFAILLGTSGFVERVKDALSKTVGLDELRSQTKVDRCGPDLLLIKQGCHNKSLLQRLHAQRLEQLLVRQCRHSPRQSDVTRDISIGCGSRGVTVLRL